MAIWAQVALLLLQVDHAAEGRKALEANQYALAVEHYQKALEAQPEDWASRFHLALALSLLDRDAEAITAYRKVLTDRPGLYEAELNLGVLLLRQNQPGEAAKWLESAASKKPKEFRPIYHLAEALRQSNAFAEAEPRFRQAIELNPKAAEAMVGLARCLIKLNRLEEAAALYRQAAETDAEFRPALLELAQVFEQAKQPEAAIAIYRQFPDHLAARERLGELLLEAGKPGEAAIELEKVYAASPTNANRVALATAYLRQKQPDKALPLLEQAVTAEPANYELRMYYGRVLRDQRLFQPAVQQFWKASQLKPDAREAWSELASALLLLENYPQALAALEKAVSLGADPIAASYFRALMLDRMRDYKQALRAYQNFLSLSQGKNPEQELISRQRIKVIEKELNAR
ncbi:MAG: tetratricopeptide repeat protein [Bryobacteraceae bacterium]|nr:tetratricopeptide repeat protein [Bryobacteraceae bacterium]MDW8378265.1 tetratricopeptide repeat protein [Bryobacterales bacterium]